MKNGKFVIERFNGVNEFVKTISSRKPNAVWAGKGLDSNTGSKNFTMTKDYAESVEIMAKGYAEGLAEMKAIKRVKVRAASNTDKRIPQVSVVGYAPHVPNAIAGIPQSMIGARSITMKSKVISIIYSIGGSASVDAGAFVKAGRNLLDVVTMLELQGYRVGVDIMCEFCENAQTGFLFVKVKEQRQPLNPLKLAYMLIHPSFFRRQCFRWLETCPDITEKSLYYGYGCALYTKCKKDMGNVREYLKKNGLLPDNVFFTNMYEARYNTAEELVKLMGIKNNMQQKTGRY